MATVPLGDGALQLIYRTPDGGMKERLLGSADEASISVATVERPFSFDGDGAAFQLACEAKRIDLAFLFDPMMAVHTSNVEPLPHQITAVYESMLPRQPLRFLLADDPGAGKTIMAGLYIRELIMHADARRILIVTPGSLVEQWRDEMFEKFGLEFSIYSALLEQASPSGNPPPIRSTVIPFSAQNLEMIGNHCSSTASRFSNVVAGESTSPIRVISSARSIGFSRFLEAAS